MTQRNHSGFSLESKVLITRQLIPVLMFLAPVFPRLCLPGSWWSMTTWTVSLAGKVALRGPLSRRQHHESEPVGCLREFHRELAPVAPLLTLPRRTAQLARAQAPSFT